MQWNWSELVAGALGAAATIAAVYLARLPEITRAHRSRAHLLRDLEVLNALPPGAAWDALDEAIQPVALDYARRTGPFTPRSERTKRWLTLVAGIVIGIPATFAASPLVGGVDASTWWFEAFLVVVFMGVFVHADWTERRSPAGAGAREVPSGRGFPTSSQ